MSGQTPTDVVNQALDAAMCDFTLGDIEEGTRPAQVCLRAYGECLRQLLRAANWDFARMQAPLLLLADASGNTQNVGTIVPYGFTYEYAYPTDCMKARFVPWNQSSQQPGIPAGNIQIGSQPTMTGLGQPPFYWQRIRPARFLIATDPNYPPPAGSSTEAHGISPANRTVILTNVQDAVLVYTAFTPYPSLWDSQFRAALVAYIASEVALPLAKEKKLGLAARREQMGIAKEKIMQARLTDGNEMFASSDIAVDWMSARNTGGQNVWWGGNVSAGPGILWGGFDACCGAASASAY